jgi:prepilin-type processing-associated H-X9-DG protein
MGLMKTPPAACRTEAFTRSELFVVIGVIAVLTALVLLVLLAAKRKVLRIGCVNSLFNVNTAFKVWEGDNDDKFPMHFALTNREAMRLISSGRAYVLWQTLSNELGTAKWLYCPADTARTAATNFNVGFSDANISYFFSLDAADTYPQMILDGDDNLAVNGERVKPSILSLPATGSLTWTKERHGGWGNIGMADGSVQQTTPTTLNAAVIAVTNNASLTMYRWVIP